MRVPGFETTYDGSSRTFIPEAAQPEEMFQGFVDRVQASMGKNYLPIARMSDGEYRLLFGYQRPSPRLRAAGRVFERIRELRRFLRQPFRVSAATLPNVSSGTYSRNEAEQLRVELTIGAQHVADHGFLALHLTYGARPFQEQYFPALRAWLTSSGIALNKSNYVPFYFVYALLSGPQRHVVLRDARILLIHSARGTKKEQIARRLREEGAAAVEWCNISAARSGLDSPDFGRYAGRVDVVMLGAGIGKFRHFAGCERLNVPVIDAGYMFEVWYEPEQGRRRPYCGMG